MGVGVVPEHRPTGEEPRRSCALHHPADEHESHGHRSGQGGEEVMYSTSRSTIRDDRGNEQAGREARRQGEERARRKCRPAGSGTSAIFSFGVYRNYQTYHISAIIFDNIREHTNHRACLRYFVTSSSLDKKSLTQNYK